MSRSPTYGTGYYGEVSKQLAKPRIPSGESSFRSLSMKEWGIYLGIGGITAVAIYMGARYLLQRRRNVSSWTGPKGVEVMDGDERKVTLYQPLRGYTVPSISPFPLKLETFLRIAEIPYEVQMGSMENPEERIPWMTLGEQLLYDARDCIPLLSKTFGINLEEGARASRLTASRLVDVMLENHIHWGIAIWRWIHDKGASLSSVQPLVPPPNSPAILEVSESVRQAANYTGLGRLPFEKVVKIIAKDLEDLSAALGKHLFFLGENPGEIDCTAFSMLAQIRWGMPDSPFEHEIKQHPNLCQFLYRMREKYWTDWNEILSKPEDMSGMGPRAFFYPINEFDMPEENASAEGIQLETDIGLGMSRKSSSTSRSTPVRGRSTVSSISRSNSPNFRTVHFNNSKTNVQSQASLVEEPDDFQQRMGHFDNTYQVKSAKNLIDHLTQQMENRDEGSVVENVVQRMNNNNNNLGRDPNNMEHFDQLSKIKSLVDTLSQRYKKTVPGGMQDEPVRAQTHNPAMPTYQNNFQPTNPQMGGQPTVQFSPQPQHAGLPQQYAGPQMPFFQPGVRSRPFFYSNAPTMSAGYPQSAPPPQQVYYNESGFPTGGISPFLQQPLPVQMQQQYYPSQYMQKQ